MAMIATDPLATVYATALLQLGEEKKILEPLVAEVESFLDGWKKSPELGGVLVSPTVPETAKLKVLGLTLDTQQPAGKLFHDFLGVLVRKGRMVNFQSICRAFFALGDVRAGLSRGTIVYSQDFGEEMTREAEKVISEYLSEKVTLDVEIDPDIIGGAIIQVGDIRLDGSVRRQLEDLRARMF